MKKKVVMCFGEQLSGQDAFQEFADKLAAAGFEVHVFEDISSLELRPHNVLTVMEQVWKDEIDEQEYYFLSNVRDFFRLCYRVYQQTFRRFIFWRDTAAPAYPVEIDDIYECLLRDPAQSAERLDKAVFTNDPDWNSPDTTARPLTDLLTAGEEADAADTRRQIIYRFNQSCYLLEPMSGGLVYIDLDGLPVAADARFAGIITPLELDEKLLAQAEDVLELLARDQATVLRRQEVIHKLFALLRAHLLTAGKIEQRYYAAVLYAVGEAYGVFTQVFTLSFFLDVYKRADIYRRLLAVCQDSRELDAQNKFYILAQSRRIELFDRREQDVAILAAETDLLKSVGGSFRQEMDGWLSGLGRQELIAGNVAIFTDQLLGASHGTTLYALELAKYLMEKAGKNVFLINTCEYLTQAGRVPYFEAVMGNIMNEYAKGNSISYEGADVPFCQMIAVMPSQGGIDGINEFLAEIKPGLVISVTDLSVMPLLTAGTMPTVCLPPRELPPVFADGFIMADKPLSDKFAALYARHGNRLLPLTEELTLDGVKADENFFAGIFAVMERAVKEIPE